MTSRRKDASGRVCSTNKQRPSFSTSERFFVTRIRGRCASFFDGPPLQGPVRGRPMCIREVVRLLPFSRTQGPRRSWWSGVCTRENTRSIGIPPAVEAQGLSYARAVSSPRVLNDSAGFIYSGNENPNRLSLRCYIFLPEERPRVRSVFTHTYASVHRSLSSIEYRDRGVL